VMDTAPAEPRVYRVSTRQKVGDVALLTLMTPVFFAMLGLLVAIPAAAVIYGAGLGDSDAQRARMLVGSAIAGALPLGLLALRGQICWSWTLLGDRLRFGAGWLAREVPYDQIKLIRAGQHELARGRGTGKPSAVPLLVETSARPRRCRIWLPPETASEALEELQRRSDAPAVTLAGKELLPRDPARRAVGVARLQRFYYGIGIPLVVGGLAGFGFVIAVALDGMDWSDAGDFLEVAAAALTALLGGLAALRKAKRLPRKARRQAAAQLESTK